MGRNILKSLFVLLLILRLSPSFALKHITKDDEAQEKVSWVLEKVYNNEFATARQRLKYFEKDYLDHPVYPLLESQIIAFSLFQSTNLEADEAKYLQKLEQALEYADVFLDQDKDDPEGAFFSLAAYGFMCLYYSDNGSFLKAANTAKKAWKHMKAGFELQETYPEFYFSSGLYNYFVVEYPKTHPIVIPATAFFPGGDKTLGLKQIQISSRQGKFTKYESMYFLGHIYGKYENNQGQAIRYFGKLIRLFPNNTYYKIRYTESLLFAGQTESAKQYIDQIINCGYQRYIDIGWVLSGMYYELIGNYDDAKKYTLKGIASIEAGNKYAAQYVYHGYTTLARVAIDQELEDTAQKLYRKVKSNSEYEFLKSEAKTYLKEN